MGIFKKQIEYQNRLGDTWYLFSKNVSLRGGKLVRIYFFNKNKKANIGTGRKEYKFPIGYDVNENPRNGTPTLSRNYQHPEEEN